MAGLLSWQPFQHVLQVGVRLVAIQLGALDQAHDGGSALATAQLPGEQPVGTSERPGADQVLDPVVVDGWSLST